MLKIEGDDDDTDADHGNNKLSLFMRVTGLQFYDYKPVVRTVTIELESFEGREKQDSQQQTQPAYDTGSGNRTLDIAL